MHFVLREWHLIEYLSKITGKDTSRRGCLFYLRSKQSGHKSAKLKMAEAYYLEIWRHFDIKLSRNINKRALFLIISLTSK